MSVQERIYDIMQQKCMKQNLVAKSAGYSPKIFNAMLRNRKIIKIDDIMRICTALRVTPNELLGFDTPSTNRAG